jgi:hypothetical protein
MVGTCPNLRCHRSAGEQVKCGEDDEVELSRRRFLKDHSSSEASEIAEAESVSDEISSYSHVSSDICLYLRGCSIKNIIDRMSCKFKIFDCRHGESLRASKPKIGLMVPFEFNHWKDSVLAFRDMANIV